MAAVSLVFPSPRAPWSRTLRRVASPDAARGHERARRPAPLRSARRDEFTRLWDARSMPRLSCCAMNSSTTVLIVGLTLAMLAAGLTVEAQQAPPPKHDPYAGMERSGRIPKVDLPDDVP